MLHPQQKPPLVAHHTMTALPGAPLCKLSESYSLADEALSPAPADRWHRALRCLPPAVLTCCWHATAEVANRCCTLENVQLAWNAEPLHCVHLHGRVQGARA